MKSFSQQNGFGFIDCPEVRSRYSRDVFIHKAQIGDLEVGDEVAFCIETNKDGHPQARDISRLDGRPPGQAPKQIEDRGGGRRKGGNGGDRQQDGEGGGRGGARKHRGGKGRKKNAATDGKGNAVEDNGNGGKAQITDDPPPQAQEEPAEKCAEVSS